MRVAFFVCLPFTNTRYIKIYLIELFIEKSVIFAGEYGKICKVIVFLLLTVAFHSIAGNVSTAKVVDEQERAITYAMRQHGEISAPDLPGKPVAELNNLQSHQISVTRIQRVQLGEYFFSLKNALQCCADRDNSLSQHWGRIYGTTTSYYCQPSSEYYVYTLRRIII